MNGRIITVTWLVVAVLSITTGCGLTPVAVEFGGSGTTDTVEFGTVPRIYSDTAPFTYSVSVWVQSEEASGVILALMSGNVFGSSSFGVTTATGGFKLYAFSSLYGSAAGQWMTNDISGTWTPGTWYHVVFTYDGSLTTNDPLIYWDGVSQTVNETSTPSGSTVSRNGARLFVGNLDTSASDYANALDGIIFDPRIYNRILTQAEITALYNSGTPSASVGTTSGLVFQAFAVRTGDTASYVDQTLTSSTNLFDAQFKAVGTVHGAPIGRAAP